MLTLNQRVQGSSACAPTNLFNQLAAHASNDSWEDVEADAQPKYAAQGQPMSFKAYHVLVPKAAVADPEPLRADAALLATDCGLRPWQRWWSWRGDEWVFGFTDHLTAFFFTNYCSQNGIPFRMRGEEREWSNGSPISRRTMTQ
jgi:hypothetical protein